MCPSITLSFSPQVQTLAQVRAKEHALEVRSISSFSTFLSFSSFVLFFFFFFVLFFFLCFVLFFFCPFLLSFSVNFVDVCHCLPGWYNGTNCDQVRFFFLFSSLSVSPYLL